MQFLNMGISLTEVKVSTFKYMLSTLLNQGLTLLFISIPNAKKQVCYKRQWHFNFYPN